MIHKRRTHRDRQRRRVHYLLDGGGADRLSQFVHRGLVVAVLAYSLNAAHALLCAVDRPEVAAGKVVNVTDERSVTLGQWAELLADHPRATPLGDPDVLSDRFERYATEVVPRVRAAVEGA